ncbi:hypothetical protein RhiTH_007641 [Rhizoctonia solani]
MTLAHPSSPTNCNTYTPPPIPEYLSRSHILNTIVGVPTDEEVEAIHNAIRALNIVSAVPTLYDSKLSTQLSQYLFTVQMGKFFYYEYIFPGENTYDPPSIPSHLSIRLEPVIGAPSDEEIELAHNGVRTLENLANTWRARSLFKTDRMLKWLSARFIQDSNRGQFAQKPEKYPSQNLTNTNGPPVPAFVSVSQQGVQKVDYTESSLSATILSPQVGLSKNNTSELEPTLKVDLNDGIEGIPVSLKLEETN